MVKATTPLAEQARKAWNEGNNTAWEWGTNWTNIGKPEFEHFVNNELFPKLSETNLIQVAGGNRFEWLAKERDFVAQFSEEYVIRDSVPVSLNLNGDQTLFYQKNFPQMITKLYGPGITKKQKFTLNNNDARMSFATLADATAYAMAVYEKRIYDINILEEMEMKGMLVDYAINQVQAQKTATSYQDLADKVFTSLLNIQNNSAKYNEAVKASGGSIGRYTTKADLEDIMILTDDDTKSYLLNEKIANTFQAGGIDITKRIVSFDDLGGCFRVTKDVKIAEQTTVDYMAAFGDYVVRVGHTVPKGNVLTYDVSALPEFADSIEEIKPSGDLFALIIDVNAIRYKRSTQNMLKKPFYNGEDDDVTYWLHYNSFKAISPFFNKVCITGSTTGA